MTRISGNTKHSYQFAESAWRNQIVLVLFILAALLASAAGIYVNAISPFWFDETFTGAVSCQPTLADSIRLTSHDVHPVLYHILTHLLFRVTGCHLWAVRISSLGFSFAGAALLLWRAWKINADFMVLFALLIGSPAFWYEGMEARSYGLLFFAACGVVSCALAENRYTRLAGIGFALLGSLVHYFAGFLFFIALTMQMVNWRVMDQRRTYLLFYAAALIATLVYDVAQIRNVMSVGPVLPFIHRPYLEILLLGVPEFFFGSPIGFLLAGAIWTGFVISRIKITRVSKALLGSFLFFVVALFSVSQFDPMFQFRYMYFLFPVLLMPFSVEAGRTSHDVHAKDKIISAYLSRMIPFALVVYMFFNAVHMMGQAGQLRNFSWVKASQAMNCSDLHPCAFVIGVPGPNLLDTDQYKSVANFWANPGSHFIPVYPADLESWLARHPAAQILWTGHSVEDFDIEGIARRAGLTCKDFRIGGAGALACT